MKYLKINPLKLILLLFILFLFLLPVPNPSLFKSYFSVLGLDQSLDSFKKSLHMPQIISSYGKVSPEAISSEINRIRQGENLANLNFEPSVCSQVSAQLVPWFDGGQMEQIEQKTLCQPCQSIAILGAQNVLLPQLLFQTWEKDERTLEIIKGDFTHVCSFNSRHNVLTILLNFSQPPATPKAQRIIEKLPQIPSVKIKNFTEEQLWEGLTNYRRANVRNDLEISEKLCSYARKRIQDHFDMRESTKEDQYPIPEKYPLDAHSGFKKDGDSGYLFEATGFSVVAENLAYWPSAQYPHHVIEWGWDLSTEGHREAQLSNEWTHGCISGKDGFYVAIFGHN